MIKRGRLLAFAAVFLLSSFLALVAYSQSAAASPCCTSNSDCYDDEVCNWPGLTCLFLGKCNTLWPDSCIQWAYANDCTSDSKCGSGKYCSLGTKTVLVAKNHACEPVSANECKSCSYPSADCNLNGGCETDLSSNVNNCGSCGKVCDFDESCKGGICIKLDPCTDNPSYYDQDSDSYKRIDCPGGNDCDDNNPNIYLGATEICGNGIDEDCNGADLSCTSAGFCGDGAITPPDEQCDGFYF